MTDRDIYLPQDRYVAALRRQRDRIAAGEKLVAWDCDDIGAKDTHCSWGLCSNDKEAWPDASDHLWPDQFEKEGRVAPKYRREHQGCPISRSNASSGCFYDCRIFKRRKDPRPDRDQVVALYDGLIAKAEGRAP